MVVGTKKKPAKLALDLSLMQTAESVGKAGKKLRLEQENLPGRKVGITYEDDEDSLFCRSLAKRMERKARKGKSQPGKERRAENKGESDESEKINGKCKTQVDRLTGLTGLQVPG